ncbi:MAG: Taurine dioxygenase [Pseudonocardia sp.]|nr:Taurine dioxygenase [Pseudonocardia sp.]
MTVAPERTALSVRPVAGHIGAEISGVDLSAPLDETTVAGLTAALHRHKVIFFRGQELDHAAQIRFGRHFGELTYAHPHDDAPPEGHPEIFTVDPERYAKRYGGEYTVRTRRKYSYVAGWHTDVTAAVNPPAASILRAEVVPEIGGDTTWTNLAAAYAGLSAPVRAFVDTLRAEHRYGGSDKPTGDSNYARRVNDNLLVAIHPVVRVHPVTGGARALRQPGLHQPHRGRGAPREPRDPRPALRRAHPARVHRPVPLGAWQRRLLGQPGDRAPRPGRPRPSRRPADPAPRDGDRRPSGRARRP